MNSFLRRLRYNRLGLLQKEEDDKRLEIIREIETIEKIVEQPGFKKRAEWNRKHALEQYNKLKDI